MDCLLRADTEHLARAPAVDWAEYYAALFLEHLAPASGQTDTLALYYMPYCPFCVMVLGVIDGLNVDIAMRDTSTNSQHRDDLIAARGRGTVPVLRITAADGSYDRWMPESRDIARYLQETYG
ncbi:MAG: glutathione S-transferase N-terminal domain-containing protein [Pseudomonadota bacterium]